MFGDTEMEKQTFYKYKSLILLEDVHMNNTLVSNTVFSGEESYKCFIGCLYHDYKITPFHIMLPKMNRYVKGYVGQTKLIQFLIEDDGLLKKYSTIWEKVSSDIKKRI